MSKLVSLLASVAVFLAGCTLTPEYTRAEPPIQAQWPTQRRPRHAAGRWSLLRSAVSHQPSAISFTEKAARQFLRRYRVVFRDLLARETLAQSWRDLLVAYRKMELKGEVRGGRFVTGFVGEQFALPEALESLRALRKSGFGLPQEIKLSAVDPLNLAGLILPGPRIPAVPTNFLIIKEGRIVRTVMGKQGEDRRDDEAGAVRDA